MVNMSLRILSKPADDKLPELFKVRSDFSQLNYTKFN